MRTTFAVYWAVLRASIGRTYVVLLLIWAAIGSYGNLREILPQDMAAELPRLGDLRLSGAWWFCGLLAILAFSLLQHGATLHAAQQNAEVQAASIEKPRVVVNHISYNSDDDGHHTGFTAYARLINPGKDPVSFDPVWFLEIQTASGQHLGRLRGSIYRGPVRTMQEAEQFEVSILFGPGDAEKYNALALLGAHYLLNGEDLRGQSVTADYTSPTNS